MTVRLNPKAAADRILGVATGAGGERLLKVAVRAPPENGKANAALLRLLAEVWRLPARDLAIVLGPAQRRKTVHVSGEPRTLLAQIEAGLRPWL